MSDVVFERQVFNESMSIVKTCEKDDENILIAVKKRREQKIITVPTKFNFKLP